MSACQECKTGYFTDENPVTRYDSENFEPNYWINYVQNGAGITAMLEPLLAIDRPRRGSLLDIGCGFGFVPHFWKTSSFGKAVGLEMSRYGKIGSEKLGIDIIPLYYSEAEDLKNQKFEYVFSSEVIEHVESPEAFVKEISQALSDDGILVLTTPSSSALTKAENYIETLAIFSPAFHFFVSSRDGLENLLRRCGFDNVVVRDTGNRLFAWASRQALPGITEGFSDWPAYLSYLDTLCEIDDPHIASGALYRATKDLFNLGYFEKADQYFERFTAIAKDDFGINFDDIENSSQWRLSRTEIENEKYPSWMGTSILYAGLIKKETERRLQHKKRYSWQLSRRCKLK